MDEEVSSEGSSREINAQFTERSILIKITFEMRKGIVSKILNEIEHLHLSINTVNVMPLFGSSDLTIVAEMQLDFNMTRQELISNLHSIFQ